MRETSHWRLARCADGVGGGGEVRGIKMGKIRAKLQVLHDQGLERELRQCLSHILVGQGPEF
jgi:hypothetical protein